MDWQHLHGESSSFRKRSIYRGARAEVKVLPAVQESAGQGYRLSMALSAMMFLAALVIANLR